MAGRRFVAGLMALALAVTAAGCAATPVEGAPTADPPTAVPTLRATATPAPVPSPAPTSAPVETATPEPAPTAQMPTATPTPVPTVAPTSTPVPTATPVDPAVAMLACILEGSGDFEERFAEGALPDQGEFTSKPRDGENSSERCGNRHDGVSPLPRIATASYVDLTNVTMISRFRAHLGHDFSDSYEDCRTMKHYTYFAPGTAFGAEPIYSPIDGVITRVSDEGFINGAHGGYQVRVVSSVDPAFTLRIFHVVPLDGYERGTHVAAGELIAMNNDTAYTNDISVQVNLADGIRYVSYFELMTAEMLAAHSAYGVATAADIAITREQRDADPLRCDGEWYLDRTLDFGDPLGWNVRG